MKRLLPCPDCRAHIRVDETGCPFCGRALDASWANAPRLAPTLQRHSRAGLLAAVAALSANAGACAETTEAPPEPPEPAPIAMPIYGAPIPTAGNGAPNPPPPPPPDGGVGQQDGGDDPVAVPVYGLPILPRDAGANTTDSSTADGGSSMSPGQVPPGPVPVYGLPPMPTPVYGLPATDADDADPAPNPREPDTATPTTPHENR